MLLLADGVSFLLLANGTDRLLLASDSVGGTVTTGGGRIIQRRNKLVYPAGAVPGIDPSHPAAKGISGEQGVSVVPTNGNFIDLTTGKKGVLFAGSPTAIIRSVGPGVSFTGTSDALDFTGRFASTSPLGMTFAAVAQLDTISFTYQCMIEADTSTPNGLLAIGPTGRLSVYMGGDNFSAISPAANTPYFFAASTRGGVYNFIALNLRTGVVETSSISGGTAIASSNGSYRLGNNSNQPLNGTLAAAMYAPTYMSMQQLLDWSKAPWEFWYPAAQRNVSFSTAPAVPDTGTGGGRVVQRFNRSKLEYPAGSLPGFDPAHPAAQRCGFSGIATNGGTFSTLLSQVRGTEFVAASKTTSLNSSLGPVTNYLNVGGGGASIFPFTSAANNPVTLAGIFNFAGVPPNTAYLLNTAANGAVGLGDFSGIQLFGGYAGASPINTGVATVVGVPYFFAMSFTTATVSYVVARLDTGQVWSGTLANPDSLVSAGDGTITVGSRGNNDRQIHGGVAAAMASNAFMSERQLRAFAQDPWAFWYPKRAQLRLVPPAPSSSGTAVGNASGVGTASAVASTSATGTAAGVGAASAVGTAITGTTGAAAGIGAALATGRATATATGASAGVGAASASTATKGAAAGIGAASATGTAIAAATAAATSVGAAAATGTGIVIATGASAGVGAATATGQGIFGATAAATGVGASTTVGLGLRIANGASAGTGAASAVSSSVGASAGVGAATASGVAARAADGAAAGVGGSSVVGNKIAAATAAASGLGGGIGVSSAGSAVAAAAGVGGGTAQGRSINVATGNAAGVGAALATGQSTFAAVASSTATGAASATGNIVAGATAAATATSAASAVGAQIAAAVASASGQGAATGSGQVGIAQATAQASATGAATATGATARVGAGAAAGVGAATAQGLLTFQATGLATGVGAASAVLRATIASVASASGQGNVVFIANAIKAAQAQASAIGQANAASIAIQPSPIDPARIASTDEEDRVVVVDDAPRATAA